MLLFAFLLHEHELTRFLGFTPFLRLGLVRKLALFLLELQRLLGLGADAGSLDGLLRLSLLALGIDLPFILGGSLQPPH